MAAKKIPFEFIERDTNPELYEMMDDLIQSYHPDLVTTGARILLAWRKGWKERGGRVTLGMCRLVSDVDASLHGYDFIIFLNAEAWQELTPEQRRALLDHELEHAGVAKDKNGEIRQDESGRAVFGLLDHDLEEFRSIVQRHGAYLDDIRGFAEAALQKRTEPLFSGLVDEEQRQANINAWG